jgi:glycosyltransferase involved in cell wall biosynthesis
VFDLGETIASVVSRVHARDPLDVFEMEESFGWASSVYHGTNVPVVVKLHGPAFVTLVDEELGTEFGREKVAREGEALRQLPAITSPCECTLSETLARYQLTPAIAERVGNPIDPSPDLPIWNLAACDVNGLVFVGRFDRVKGGDLMIEAFRRLLKVKSDARLTFVGPDNGLVRADGTVVHLPEFLASLQDPELEARLVCTGSLPRGEVPAVRTRALVNVMTSRRENQPYSALEAMLQACPLVCSDTSGLSEIVEHGVTGLKARPADPDDLVRQIRRILDNPALGRSLGLAAREYVLAHHAPATVASGTVEVYQRAIALQRSRVAGRR